MKVGIWNRVNIATMVIQHQFNLLVAAVTVATTADPDAAPVMEDTDKDVAEIKAG